MPYVFEDEPPRGYKFEDAPTKPAPYGAGSEMLSGLTFGFGDELRARMTGEPIEAIRAGQQQYREQNPGASLAANVAGSLPTMAIPGLGAANVARGIGMAGAVARGAAALGTGAGYGALSGAGEAVEGQRGAGAARGAVQGAIGGAIGAGVGRGIQAVSQRRLTTLPGDLQAQSIALGRLQASGMTPQQAVQNLAEGKMLGELSRPLETLTGAVVRRSPEAAQQAVDVAARRKASRPEELLNRVRQEVTGGQSYTMSQIESVTAAQRKASTPLYQRAFAEAGPIQSPLIDDLMTLEPFQMAYKRAQSIAKLERNPIPDYKPGKPLSLRAANYIKQGLDEVVYGAKRDPASSIGKTQLGLIDQLRGDFVREVDSMAPESYRAARSIYAGGARNQEAADAGRNAWKAGPEYVAQFLSGASEAEKNAFRAGANAILQEEAAKLGANREAFRALMDSPMRQQVAQQLSGITGPSYVPKLVTEQRRAAEFENRLMGGSQTAERQAADAALADESIPMKIIKQGPVNTMLQSIADRAQTGGNKVTSELGSILLNPSLDANTEMLRRLGLLDEQLRRQAGIRAGSYTTGAAGGGLLGGNTQ